MVFLIDVGALSYADKKALLFDYSRECDTWWGRGCSVLTRVTTITIVLCKGSNQEQERAEKALMDRLQLLSCPFLREKEKER